MVEAKRAEPILTEDAVGQARGYSLWLTAPYYLITNGDELRLYLFRGAVQAHVQLMALHRTELREQWPTLYKMLNKEAVIQYKSQWQKVLGSTNSLPVGV